MKAVLRYSIFCFLLLCCSISGYAQVKVGDNFLTMDSSAVFELESSNKGFLPPRMTDGNMRSIAMPAEGLFVYNNSAHCFSYRNDSSWINLLPFPGEHGWNTNGNLGTDPNLNFIGTSDPTPLSFRVNNQISGLINHIQQNAFFGYQCGNYSMSGGNNAFFGSMSGTFNSGGEYNTFMGAGAGYSNSSGSYNTVVGAHAAYNITTALNNAVLGNDAGFSLLTGSGNLFAGKSAGHDCYIGQNNVALGMNAGNNISSGSNNIAIGYNTPLRFAEGNNQINIGNTIFRDSSGRIGLGVSEPNSSVQFGGSVSYAIQNTNSSISLDDQQFLLCDASASSIDVYLPLAAGHSGRTYTIKKTDSSANVVSLHTGASEMIDGSSTVSINTRNQYLTIITDGSNWFIVANN
jgi:hypothetical protein